MWYWNPVDCNEALPGVHDLSHCIEIDDDEHPFKKGSTPDGKMWSNDENNHPVLIDVPPPTHEQLVASAVLRKSELLANAEEIISIWQTKLLLGIINDKDKASLITWLAYIDDLTATDTNTAPDINWPALPVA